MLEATLDPALAPAVVSTAPVVLPATERGVDLQVRVTAPLAGRDLPLILFSHGFGQSMNSHAPLVDYWAAHGFVVVQPTHLDSSTLGLTPSDPRSADIWRYRVGDLVTILDHLDAIEAVVPAPGGRLDRTRVAVSGHSWGAQTASMLLGARVLDDAGEPGPGVADARVTAGVLLAIPGTGDSLSPFAAENFPFMRPDFGNLTSPALVVAGDHDDSPLSTRGPDWFTDAYRLAPGARNLLTLFGAEHSLSGIVGEGVVATTDESPDRVALLQRITAAFLSTVLGVDPGSLTAAAAELARESAPVGRLDTAATTSPVEPR